MVRFAVCRRAGSTLGAIGSAAGKTSGTLAPLAVSRCSNMGHKDSGTGAVSRMAGGGAYRLNEELLNCRSGGRNCPIIRAGVVSRRRIEAGTAPSSSFRCIFSAVADRA
jgi:hypothetical protein